MASVTAMRRVYILWLMLLLAGIVPGLDAHAAANVFGLKVFVTGGERYHSLKDVASLYHLSLRAPVGRSVYVQGKWMEMEFEVDSRRATVNGTQVWLHNPVAKVWSRWLVSEADVRKTLDPLVRPSKHLARQGTTVVVLDPGHGGEDAGAKGRRNVEEKRVVLDVAKRARVHLANAGVKVYLTRETDRFIPLNDRTAKAAKWNADIFVSIHLNAATTRTAQGVETYVIAAAGCQTTAAQKPSRSDATAFAGNLHDEANVVLGYHLQRALHQKTKSEDRGLRRARFAVLRNAPCPAALLECGFLSNAGEEERMLSADHRETIALAIAQGVLDYIKAVRHAKVSQ